MIVETIPVGVEVERRPGVTRWQRVVWRPVALIPSGKHPSDWTVVEERGDTARYFAGNASIELRSADTKVLKDNVESPTPSVFIVLRRAPIPSGWALHLATADPSEAHAHADVGDDLVEALPMPPPILCRVSAFIARHHVDRPEWRRRRDRPDPESLGRRPVVGGPEHA